MWTRCAELLVAGLLVLWAGAAVATPSPAAPAAADWARTTLAFADAEIPAGLFARTVPPSGPNGSYCICLAERYASDESLLPLLVAYHIPTVNYGRMPTAEDALAFGAALLGLSEDEYHHHLCAAVDDGQQGLLAG